MINDAHEHYWTLEIKSCVEYVIPNGNITRILLV